MSTVAVIMATYNGEKYIREQIDSILASTFQDFELFIYDDGSKDNTMLLLREYEVQNPDKIHVFANEKNMGVTLNFLRALSITTMDYAMFCDQDDVWMPNKIALTLKRMRHMEAQAGRELPIAVFTDAMVVDQKLKVLKNSFFLSNHLNPMKTDLAHILMENKLIGCTVMVNSALRKVLLGSSMPSQARYHDWWVALIASSMGKIGYVNERTLYYRQHGGNVVGGSDFVSYFKNRMENLRKQKEAINALSRQAGEFLMLYDSLLSEHNREMIRSFAELNQYSYFKKRRIILCYGFLKTGIIRNIGLFIIV